MAYRDDGVILLHGIARGSRSMGMMDRVLRDAGYKTLNLGYPSRYWGLGELAAQISALSRCRIGGLPGRVHFVTHSMGGLVARALITRDRPEKLGRVVMLGPPNQGSEIADMLSGTILYKQIFGPAGAQLATRRTEDLAAVLGLVDFPLGIIAGKRSIDPLSWLILPKPNDGKVTVERRKGHRRRDQNRRHERSPGSADIACPDDARSRRHARDAPLPRRRSVRPSRRG